MNDEFLGLGVVGDYRRLIDLPDGRDALVGEVLMLYDGWMQLAFLLAAVLVLAKPLGEYIARVFTKGRLPLIGRIGQPVEATIYRMAGVRCDDQQNWIQYAVACLLFNLVGFIFLYLLQLLQQHLPLNPAHQSHVPAALAFNTAASFVTNTNWQNYAGETTMSLLTQMLGMTVQNFLSAATGIAVMAAFLRGLASKGTGKLGSFWVDLVRSTLYILLPLAIITSLVLASQGVVQTFHATRQVHTLSNTTMTAQAKASKASIQNIAMGPVASQEAIKQIGTNGGGFFNANSAHPFENPNGLTDFVEMLAMLLIPAASCFTFSRMIGDKRQGRVILVTMAVIFALCATLCITFEQQPNPILPGIVNQHHTGLAPGGNMEGKEVRFGPANSAIWTCVATGTSTGAVNSMLDSYTPFGGLIPMWLMKTGEVIFGGVGVGLTGMLITSMVAVFLCGLMVGRTPEYLGKKLGAFEIKMVSLAILIPPALVLIGTAIASVTPSAIASVANPGSHGFSEILYAMTSMSNNNGSAFAGLNGDTNFYNILGGVMMLAGRFWSIVATLALAGAMANRKPSPPSVGTFPTHTPLFAVILAGTIALISGLIFLPALALGPIAEGLAHVVH